MEYTVLNSRDYKTKGDFYNARRKLVSQGYIVVESSKKQVKLQKKEETLQEKIHNEVEKQLTKKSNFYEMISYISQNASNTGFIVIPIKSYEIKKPSGTIEETNDDDVFILKLT
jgi:hypothetical protein